MAVAKGAPSAGRPSEITPPPSDAIGDERTADDRQSPVLDSMAVSSNAAIPEVLTLADAEATIRRGLLEASNALRVIRDRRLYKEAGYTSFDNYTRDRLGFSRDRADQIITAGDTVSNLPTIVGSRLNESHVRALRPIADDPEMCAEVLAEVEAEDGKITAKAIAAKVAAGSITAKLDMVEEHLGIAVRFLVDRCLSVEHVEHLLRVADILDGAVDKAYEVSEEVARRWMEDDDLVRTFPLMTRPWDGFSYMFGFTSSPNRDTIIEAFRLWWREECERTEPAPAARRVALHLAAMAAVEPSSADTLRIIVGWFDDIINAALLAVAAGDAICEEGSREWFCYRSDLRHAGFDHLTKDPAAARERWLRTETAERMHPMLHSDTHLNEEGWDANVLIGLPSAIQCDESYWPDRNSRLAYSCLRLTRKIAEALA